jgi:hypothetical protein
VKPAQPSADHHSHPKQPKCPGYPGNTPQRRGRFDVVPDRQAVLIAVALLSQNLDAPIGGNQRI